MRMLFRLTILGLAVYGGKTLYERYGRDVREAVASPSIDQLLAPFRRQVEESGMSDEQLDAFYENLRRMAFAERNVNKAAEP